MCVQEPCVYLLSAASVVIRNSQNLEPNNHVLLLVPPLEPRICTVFYLFFSWINYKKTILHWPTILDVSTGGTLKPWCGLCFLAFCRNNKTIWYIHKATIQREFEQKQRKWRYWNISIRGNISIENFMWKIRTVNYWMLILTIKQTDYRIKRQ